MGYDNHDHSHHHDNGHDHNHDHDDPGPGDENLIWRLDNVLLNSVGINVGSSGTQVVFSRLHLQRSAPGLTSRFVVVERRALYRSPVRFTPFASGRLIDAAELGRILDDAYAEAGLSPGHVDTGVVLLTGEALRRRNAAAIAGTVAERAGRFVCVAAGHHLEARLAGYGSGAAEGSLRLGRPVLNVDIGGATTKLALVEGGRVVRTAAFEVGGRLVVVDAEDRIVRVEPAGVAHAARVGLRWAVGERADSHDRAAVANVMADIVVDALTVGTDAPTLTDLLLTDPLGPLPTLGGVQFSGGVAEYIYHREERDFGDLGRLLGLAIRDRIEAGRVPYPLLLPTERIRATVLGASEYSVQLSGNTGYFSNPTRLLPRRDLRVLRPSYELGDDVDPTAIASAIANHVAGFDLEPDAEFVLALTWSGLPEYQRLAAFAQGVADGLGDRLTGPVPTYLALNGDIAHSLGTLLRTEFSAGDLLVVDGLDLWDFEFVDLGPLQQPSGTVAVTIKSLVFDDDARPLGSVEREAGEPEPCDVVAP